VGHINHFDRFAEGMAELSNAPTHLVREFYQRRHSAPEKSSTLLDHYTIDEITRLRQFMSDEYAIYHELCRFLSKEVQEALI
jgi:galactokinase